MITVSNYRSNGGPEVLLSNPRRTLEEALRQLVVSELGYGGCVTKATATRLEVETLIMSSRDRTIFEGPQEEMLELLAATVVWGKAEKKVSFEEWWKKVSEVTDGVPLLVKMAAPFIKADLVFKEIEKLHA